jgi:hypothetical protein
MKIHVKIKLNFSMQRKFNYHAQTLKNFQIVHYVGIRHRQFLRKFGE